MATNYYDDTKNFLEKSRLLKKRKLQEMQDLKDDVYRLTEIEKKQEEEQFQKAINSQVEFGDFKVYQNGNVEFNGKLMTEGVNWFFSLDDTEGCYIQIESLLQLRNETLDTLNKLKGYYMQWRTEWVNKVNQFINKD